MSSARHATVVADYSILNCTFSSPVGVVRVVQNSRLNKTLLVDTCSSVVLYCLVLEIQQVPAESFRRTEVAT